MRWSGLFWETNELKRGDAVGRSRNQTILNARPQRRSEWLIRRLRARSIRQPPEDTPAMRSEIASGLRRCPAGNLAVGLSFHSSSLLRAYRLGNERATKGRSARKPREIRGLPHSSIGVSQTRLSTPPMLPRLG
jgi:hypothetical protein